MCVCYTLANLCYIDDLIPLILVELLFVVAVSASEADLITNTIDSLIRQQLVPEKSNVRYDPPIATNSGARLRKYIVWNRHTFLHTCIIKAVEYVPLSNI